MAQKFHTGPNGPGVCSAKTAGGCPFGGESGAENHYDTMEEAVAAFEDKMDREYGFATEQSPVKVGSELFSWDGSNSPFGHAVSAKVTSINADGSAVVELDFYSVDDTDTDEVIADALSTMDSRGFGGDSVEFEIKSKYGWETSKAVYDPEDYDEDEEDEAPIPDVDFPLEMGWNGLYGSAIRRDSSWVSPLK